MKHLMVVARRDPEAKHIWIAQTIQGDLVGQGSTLGAALNDLKNIVLSMLSRYDSDETFAMSAPNGVQQLFEIVLGSGTEIPHTDADQNVNVLATWLQVTGESVEFLPAAFRLTNSLLEHLRAVWGERVEVESFGDRYDLRLWTDTLFGPLCVWRQYGTNLDDMLISACVAAQNSLIH